MTQKQFLVRRKILAVIWTGIVSLVYPLFLIFLFLITTSAPISSLSEGSKGLLWTWCLRIYLIGIIPWLLIVQVAIRTFSTSGPRWLAWIGGGSVLGIALALSFPSTMPDISEIALRPFSSRIMYAIIDGAFGIGIADKLIAIQYWAMIFGGIRKLVDHF